MTILYYSISKGLKFPPVLKKRGRPKGHDCTTIGQPDKQLKRSNKPKSFSRKHYSEEKEVHIILNGPAMTVYTYSYNYCLGLLIHWKLKVLSKLVSL